MNYKNMPTRWRNSVNFSIDSKKLIDKAIEFEKNAGKRRTVNSFIEHYSVKAANEIISRQGGECHQNAE